MNIMREILSLNFLLKKLVAVSYTHLHLYSDMKNDHLHIFLKFFLQIFLLNIYLNVCTSLFPNLSPYLYLITYNSIIPKLSQYFYFSLHYYITNTYLKIIDKLYFIFYIISLRYKQIYKLIYSKTEYLFKFII